MDRSIYYEIVPEHYVGYSDPPVVITVSAKASYLEGNRGRIDSILSDAFRKIANAEKEERCPTTR